MLMTSQLHDATRMITGGRPAVDRGRRSKCTAACDSCKRRKERCNGEQPCRRCISRGVSDSCSISDNTAKSHARKKQRERFNTIERSQLQETALDSQVAPSILESMLVTPKNPCSRPVKVCRIEEQPPVLVSHPSGFALLHNVRRVVQRCLGNCEFLSDLPSTEEHLPAMITLQRPTSWQASDSRTKPALSEARYYIRRFLLATSWWLDIDTTELLLLLPKWVESPMNDSGDIHDAIYYMVFAIGAQTCPEDRDAVAANYFNLSRHWIAELSADEPTIPMVQAYCLVAMYLVGDSRVNAAFAHMGMAVRAAHVLGLHSHDFSARFSPANYKMRERVWKSVRFLDTFLSASTGRSPSTRETRDTDFDAQSPALGICHIYERIMNDVYTRDSIHMEALNLISKKQRTWATRLTETLELDSIENSVNLDSSEQLNISLLHVKQSFYCSIILLTWPSFFERVEESIRPSQNGGRSEQSENKYPATDATSDFRTYACIDSAIRMIDVLAPLAKDMNAPKRLPVIMNSAFVAALVVGAALFARFENMLPLAQGMKKAIALFRRFSCDPLARQFGDIVERLNGAWEQFQVREADCQTQLRRRLMSDTFGTLDSIAEAPGGAPRSAVQAADTSGAVQAADTGGVEQVSLYSAMESYPSPWDMVSGTSDAANDLMHEHEFAELDSVTSFDNSLLPDSLMDYDFDWTTLIPAPTDLESSQGLRA